MSTALLLIIAVLVGALLALEVVMLLAVREQRRDARQAELSRPNMRSVAVLSLPISISDDAAKVLKAELAEALGATTKVLVLDRGMHFQLLEMPERKVVTTPSAISA